MRVLVTGAAGFIGMHVTAALLDRGDDVVGWDNLNDYYDVSLKQARLSRLLGRQKFSYERIDIADDGAVSSGVADGQFDLVVHLAAQAGVRYSLENPHSYAQSNIVGFLNVLEGCRHGKTSHLVYASSSSVYGGRRDVPFRESDAVDHPVSLYAATKKSNELMAHCYSSLFGLPTTGLRFFTVYGPWGRPDMAYYKFTQAMLAREPIPVYNRGDLRRDFTYIDDIVAGVLAVLDRPPCSPPGEGTPYRVLNIGGAQPVQLLDFIAELEQALGVPAILDLKPMQPGDVYETHADVSRLNHLTGSSMQPVALSQGLHRFVNWYREYHRV